MEGGAALTVMDEKTLDCLVVKPAGPDCNLACHYCYYSEKADLFPGPGRHRMSPEILETLIRRTLAESGPAVSYGWQGGEPTLMGLPFFEKAVGYQREYGAGHTVDNSLQTNGFLLGEKWAEFLAEYNFLVGLSLDGPGHIHDRYRRRRDGRGTFETVQGKADLLLKRGVEVNVLCCVTDYSVNHPRELYEYFKSMGLKWMQFIPVLEKDKHDPRRAAPFSVDAERFGDFLCAVFDLWLDDFRDGVPTTFVRWFESVLYTYVGVSPPECTLQSECGNYLLVEHNGDVYSCDFFVEPEWKLGNITYASPAAMLNSRKQREFGRRKAALPGPCSSCDHLVHCRGGCPKDRFMPDRGDGWPGLCRGYKKFFAHADGCLRELAQRFRKAGDAVPSPTST
jgi:uncharacterized protein